jgi:uncharacterized protein YnzC (UPF0291/DUF896 family)
MSKKPVRKVTGLWDRTHHSDIARALYETYKRRRDVLDREGEKLGKLARRVDKKLAILDRKAKSKGLTDKEIAEEKHLRDDVLILDNRIEEIQEELERLED